MRIRSTVSVLLVSVLAAISLRATSLQDEQRYVVLHVPGFAQTIPWGVNDAGEAVGSAIKCIPDPQGGYPIYEYHGFAYQNGVYSLIDYPGALYMTPTAINSQGAQCSWRAPRCFRLNAWRVAIWRARAGKITSRQVPSAASNCRRVCANQTACWSRSSGIS